MTTQAEVARAFAERQDAPNVATNFRRIEAEDSTKEYLCGGRNGNSVVLAVREPMGRFRVYRQAPVHGAGMYYSSVRRHLRRARSNIRQFLQDEYGEIPDALLEELHEEAPLTEDVDDLDI